MVDGGTISLGIGLSALSVAIGILGLVLKSECEEVSVLWGCVHCKKKRRQKKRESPPPDDTVIVNETDV